MTKEIFTPDERRVLEIYRRPESSGLGRVTRLSVQYLLGAGIFTYLAVAYQSWCALVSYLVFVVYVGIRSLGARQIVGVMPGIIAKFESRIAELEAGAGALGVSDQHSKHSEGESNS